MRTYTNVRFSFGRIYTAFIIYINLDLLNWNGRRWLARDPNGEGEREREWVPCELLTESFDGGRINSNKRKIENDNQTKYFREQQIYNIKKVTHWTYRYLCEFIVCLSICSEIDMTFKQQIIVLRTLWR
jgi:hypothetical protein